MDLRTDLHELAEKHQGIHGQLPLVSALAEGTLPLQAYVSLLQSFLVIHVILEQALEGASHPAFSSPPAQELNKAVFLETDLSGIQPHSHGQTSMTHDVALRAGERIRLRSVEDPVSLLGFLLVFRNPEMMRAISAEAVAATLGFEGGKGVRFLSSFDAETWNAETLSGALNGVQPTEYPGIQEAMTEAASALTDLLVAAFPPQEGRSSHLAVGLNPEAGRHPVPADPREVAAAVEGGRNAWYEFPYMKARYGSRGEKFTSSDAAWLVTLTEHPQETVTRQVLWLAGVMASRGMPRFIMEVSLQEIHATLLRAVPDRKERYRRLLVAKEELKRRRTAWLKEETQEALIREFDPSLKEAAGAQLSEELLPVQKNLGMLIMSAVMDDLDGVKKAQSSLREWISDPDRFPPSWIRAVDRAFQAAATAARPET